MPDRQLRDMLVKLDAELRSGAAIADQDRALLEQVKRDLEAVLAAPTRAAEDGGKTLRDRLDAAISRFESDHPGLANLMGAAMDALNRLGV